MLHLGFIYNLNKFIIQTCRKESDPQLYYQFNILFSEFKNFNFRKLFIYWLSKLFEKDK
jgi:hypothetical protein